MPPTWKTTGMPASWARAHTGSRPMWLGEWPGGQPDATSRAAAPMLERLVGQAGGGLEVEERHVAAGQQAVVDRAELDHAPVVGPGGADGQLGVVAVLPVAQPPVVERVEDQLAREPEEVEGPGPVLGQERAGGGEVLAGHDLARPRRPGTRRERACRPAGRRRRRGRCSCSSGSPVWRSSLPLPGPSGAMRSRTDGIGVVAQPRRRLHDVRIGVVDDPTRRVGHQATPAVAGSRSRSNGEASSSARRA